MTAGSWYGCWWPKSYEDSAEFGKLEHDFVRRISGDCWQAMTDVGSRKIQVSCAVAVLAGGDWTMNCCELLP